MLMNRNTGAVGCLMKMCKNVSEEFLDQVVTASKDPLQIRKESRLTPMRSMIHAQFAQASSGYHVAQNPSYHKISQYISMDPHHHDSHWCCSKETEKRLSYIYITWTLQFTSHDCPLRLKSTQVSHAISSVPACSSRYECQSRLEWAKSYASLGSTSYIVCQRQQLGSSLHLDCLALAKYVTSHSDTEQGLHTAGGRAVSG